MDENPVQTLVFGYLDKWPEVPSLTLAKKIYKEHPNAFPSLDAARSKIRFYRGKAGEDHRRRNIEKRFYEQGERSKAPFNLPESYAKPRTPVEIEGKRILCLYDLHIPYHENEAIEIALKEGHKRKCDTVFLGGDILDCHLLSNFVKEPDARKFGEELEATRQFIRYVRQRFPKATIYYKEGNHEERFFKYMRIKAPELLDVKEFSLPKILWLEHYGVEWVHGRTKANIGKLSIFHGHEFGKTVFSPVNPARGLFMRTKASSMCGHYHQTSEHPETTVNGKIITCWSVGGLCHLSPEFRPYSNWNHGFAVIEKEGDMFHVENKKIYQGHLI